MGITRRQIQHVARLQNELFLWHKVSQNFQGYVGLQAQVFLAPNAPAPAAVRLQQKHVVAVKVGTDAAGVCGVADHQVVQPRIGHKAKLVHQRVHCVVLQVNALHQNGPAGTLQSRQGAALKRAVLEAPTGRLSGILNDHACLAIFKRGHFKQLSAIQQWLEARNGLAHQQRLFLPMALHE